MTNNTDALIDKAFANGVRAALQRLWAIRERTADEQAWADCEAMINSRRVTFLTGALDDAYKKGFRIDPETGKYGYTGETSMERSTGNKKYLREEDCEDNDEGA